MANDDIPRGLVPLNLNPGQVHYYRVSTGSDIFLGQPVRIVASGFVEGTSGQGVYSLLGVAVGFAGTQKRGLATRDPFLDVSDLTPPDPSSDTGDRYVAVADDPAQEFVIQEDTGGSAISQAGVGTLANDIFRGSAAATVSGNLITGWAGLELDADSIVTTSAASYQVLRFHDAINSDGTENTSGNFAKVVVRIYHHQKIGGQQALAAI